MTALRLSSSVLPALLLICAGSLVGGEGVAGRLFPNRGFDGPAEVQPAGAVDATWPVSPLSGGKTPYSAIWQGVVVPRYNEPYTLVVKTQGRFALWLDGVLAASGSSEVGGSRSVAIGAQPRSFRLEYSDWDGVGRCALWWKSASEGAIEKPVPASQLKPLVQLVAALPASSPVSPVCIAFGRPHSAVVQAEGAGGGTVGTLDGCTGWADVPLAVGGPTAVRLSIAGGQDLAGQVDWSATDVATGGAIVIRRDDALLLASPQAGALRVAGPGGQLSMIPVAAGVPVAQAFTAGGSWTVTALDAVGASLGSLAVAVADIALPERMACQVNWVRTIRSPATPDGAIQVALSRPMLGYSGAATGEVAGRCSYTLKPTTAGEQALVYRLASGAILAACPVDGYTITSNIYTGNYVFVRDDAGYGHGQFLLAMSPRLSYQAITIDFFVTTVRIGGLSRIELTGADLAADGTWTAPFVVSPNQWKSCHRIKVTQEMPAVLPTPPNAIAARISEVVGMGVDP